MQDEQEQSQIELNLSKVADSCQKLKDKGYKIMVVYQPITGQSVARDFYISMLTTLSGEVFNYMLEKHKVIIKPMVSGHFPIDFNRNAAVKDAMERYKADYMFFMDTDQTFPHTCIPTMFEALLDKHREGFPAIMAGMYFLKKHPWSGVFGRYIPETDPESKEHWEFMEKHGWVVRGQQTMFWKHAQFWDKGSIFRVDVIGAGCMMMDVEVFRRLEKPYFKYSPDPRMKDPTMLKASEDMWFCHQLYKAQIPIWMNSNISCGHLANYESNEPLFTANRDQMFATLPMDKKRELYSKILDVRSEAEKVKFRQEILEEV